MSYVLKIVIPTVPAYNLDAFAFTEALIARSQDEVPSPRLLQFHEAITARYPCASSGFYANSSAELSCPWTDSPLIECFSGDVGVIGVSSRNAEVVPFVLRRAGSLALTVIDEQANKVYRPATFSVNLVGMQKNVNVGAMVSKLVPLLKLSPARVLILLDTPNGVVKRGLNYVAAQRFMATMELIGADCCVVKEGSASAQGTARAAAKMPVPRVAAAPIKLRKPVANIGESRLMMDDFYDDGAGQGWSPSWMRRVLDKVVEVRN